MATGMGARDGDRDREEANGRNVTVISTRATVIDVTAIVIAAILAGGVVANAVRELPIPSELSIAFASVVSYYFGARTRRDMGG